ncbi:MAG: hypothetical protein AMDU1_APLC00008G0009 [Thermoplasmatales archaeon A-plasma]|nr:MAG: hypothetical protein AMDU1_APLC00008G0009 [Thermoplasmatales archaeon A-plasma]
MILPFGYSISLKSPINASYGYIRLIPLSSLKKSIRAKATNATTPMIRRISTKW